MGDQLTDYEGAVVFIDLLGFGALTNGKIPLNEKAIEPWLTGSGHKYNHHYLAAHLLVELRALLQELNQNFSDIKVAQLSDCFFAWSKKTDQVIKFTHAFMHRAIETGILCRGGMAYGQIIETNRNHSLGRLILGDAVTRAVGLEKLAKGARLLTEPDLVTALNHQNKKMARQMIDFFQPVENPLDFQVYDEFKWYLVDDLTKLPDYGPLLCTINQRLEFTQNRLKLDTLLIHSPRFAWNAGNAQGNVHLRATSNFLSESGLLNISHKFERRGFPESRSYDRVDSITQFVNSDPGYSDVPPVQKDDEYDN